MFATSSQPITGVKRELEDAKTPGAKKKVSFATTPSEEAPTTPGGAPPPSTATKYKDRSNGGTLVEVQNKHLARREPWADVAARAAPCVVKALTAGDVAALTRSPPGDDPSRPAVGAATKYRHMFTPPGERSAALDASARHVGDAMLAARKLTEPDAEATPVGAVAPNPSFFLGRVCLDALDGKLNKASVALEGDRRDGGYRAKLDLSAVESSYALFPGQVIGVDGCAPHDDGTIVARKLTLGAAPPKAAANKEDVPGRAAPDQPPASIWVAAGPFTTSDDLEYQPLLDLLAAAKAAKPDVVVLLGPFVDADHPAAKRAQLDADGDEPVDAATLFVLKVAWELDRLLESSDCHAQFVLAPSTRDLVSEPVYPQPPLGAGADEAGDKPSWQDEFPLGSLELPKSDRVHLVGNPGLFAVDGAVVAVTATDVLFQLSSQEIFENKRDGAEVAALPRVARLASHLVSQRSFYPLFPAPAMASTVAEAPVDLRQHAKWRLPVAPDLLIAPSRLAPFARDVSGTLVLNPGHLAKNAGGGTFAQLAVHPHAELAGDAVAADLPARSRVEITRI